MELEIQSEITAFEAERKVYESIESEKALELKRRERRTSVIIVIVLLFMLLSVSSLSSLLPVLLSLSSFSLCHCPRYYDRFY